MLLPAPYSLAACFLFWLQAQSYTNYFADALVAEAKRDSRIIGIHAAMGGGTGMNRFEKVICLCQAIGFWNICPLAFLIFNYLI